MAESQIRAIVGRLKIHLFQFVVDCCRFGVQRIHDKSNRYGVSAKAPILLVMSLVLPQLPICRITRESPAFRTPSPAHPPHTRNVETSRIFMGNDWCVVPHYQTYNIVPLTKHVSRSSLMARITTNDFSQFRDHPAPQESSQLFFAPNLSYDAPREVLIGWGRSVSTPSTRLISREPLSKH